MKKVNLAAPKILFIDIETAPIIANVWGLWDENVGLNQIKEDWHLLSFSAKWAGSSTVYYWDQSKEKDITNDRGLLQHAWGLLDEADIVVGHYSSKFDCPKLNSRFVLHGMQPPSPYKQIDTRMIASRRFGFTSNKLEFLSDKLCTKYKKQTKRKFAGFELWKECVARNHKAWREMRKYNMYDVLALEELYHKLRAWDPSINFDVYHDKLINVCSCGSTDWVCKGFGFSTVGKYQRYKCKHCGVNRRAKENLLTTEKRKSLRTGEA